MTSFLTIAMFMLAVFAIIGALCVTLFILEHFGTKDDSAQTGAELEDAAVMQEKEVGRLMFKLRRATVLRQGRAPRRLDSEYDNRN